MQTFLSGDAIAAEVRSLIKKSKGPLRIAVAYWGSDSVERVGLSRRGRPETRILCNAHSGVCSPEALNSMIRLPRMEVRSSRRLHAKVYCADDCVIVGSANASANGLGFESEGEVGGLHEAAILSREPNVVAAVVRWFDDLYSLFASEVVDEQLIETIRPIWNAQRRKRSAVSEPNSLDVLEALDRHPGMLRDRGIKVSIYRNSARTEQAESITAKLEKSFKGKRSEERYDPIPGLTFRALDSYETNHMRPEVAKSPAALSEWTWESWLIDVTDPSCVFWYVPKRSAVQEFEDEKGMIGFVVPVYASDRLPLGDGLTHLTISKKSHKELGRRIREKLKIRGGTYLDVDVAELARPIAKVAPS